MARTVVGCIAQLEVLAPSFRRASLESLEELTVGVAWLDGAQPLVAARVREATAFFPRSRELDWPRVDVGALFMREVADVHRELYAEHAELYGEGVATKIERCLAVSDAEAAIATRARDERLPIRAGCLRIPPSVAFSLQWFQILQPRVPVTVRTSAARPSRSARSRWGRRGWRASHRAAASRPRRAPAGSPSRARQSAPTRW